MRRRSGSVMIVWIVVVIRKHGDLKEMFGQKWCSIVEFLGI